MADSFPTAIISAVTALLGGGGVWTYLKLRAEREVGEIGRLRSDLERHAKQLEECKEHHALLEQWMWAVEQAQDSHLARWLKNSERCITWVNDKAFLSIFAPLGFRREQVLGHSFADLLKDGHAIAEIDRLDEAALARPDLAASNLIRLHPSLPMMVVVKQVASGRDGELVFEGYAYRTNDKMVTDGLGVERQMLQIEASAGSMINDG